jgi:hypothetical protein
MMIEMLSRSSGKVIGLKVSGKLIHADYQKFVPIMERLIQEHGSLRCYIEVTGLPMPTPHALWDELTFDVKHCREIERCAIVSDKSWVKRMAKASGVLFRKAEIRCFDLSESEKAWGWLGEEVPCCDFDESEAAVGA